MQPKKGFDLTLTKGVTYDDNEANGEYRSASLGTYLHGEQNEF